MHTIISHWKQLSTIVRCNRMTRRRISGTNYWWQSLRWIELIMAALWLRSPCWTRWPSTGSVFGMFSVTSTALPTQCTGSMWRIGEHRDSLFRCWAVPCSQTLWESMWTCEQPEMRERKSIECERGGECGGALTNTMPPRRRFSHNCSIDFHRFCWRPCRRRRRFCRQINFPNREIIEKTSYYLCASKHSDCLRLPLFRNECTN